MGICVNPYCGVFCQATEQNKGQEHCHTCDSSLLISNRYRLLKLLKPLQKSQQTKVFEAEDLKHNNRLVVLKLLDLPYLQERNLLKREYEFLVQMPPPFLQIGIDDFFEFSPHPDLPVKVHCLVLPKLMGMDSEQYVHEKGPLSIEQALKWIKQLIQFVELIHQKGYIHRDIKPSNLIISNQQKLTLIDFGTVRKIDAGYLSLLGANVTSFQGARATHTRVISAGYSAPEQVEGAAIPQSDFYAMARTFAFWVTGQHPRELIKGESEKLLWKDVVPNLSPSLGQFMNKMMAFKADQRPINIDAIEHFLEKRWPILRRREALKQSKRIKFLIIILGLSLAAVGYYFIRWGTARYFFYRGSNQSFQGNFEAAKLNFERAIQLDVAFEDAYHNLAALCQNSGDHDCALKNYQEALELNPTHWQTHHNLGGLYEDSRDYVAAEKHYQKAIVLSQNTSILPLNNLARIRILNQRPAEAIQLAKMAIQLTSNAEELAILNKNLGWAYFEQEKDMQAINYLTLARDWDVRKAEPYCLLAQIYDRQSKTVDAKNNWLACFSLDSSAPEVFEWRTEALTRMMK